MNIGQVREILEYAENVEKPILINGPHGIGKSEVVIEFSKTNNYHYEILMLGNQEKSDLIGIPHITEKDGKFITTWSVPIWLQRMYDASAEGKQCVLFLDELNRADRDVRQSALQLVLDGRIHEHSLPVLNNKKTFVVSAINPSDQYQVDVMDPALIDRFLICEVEVHVPTWLKWARENKIHNSIIEFINQNPKFLHRLELEDDKKAPSPRSWTHLSKFLTTYDNIPRDILYNIMKGIISETEALSFLSFYEEFIKSISVDDLIIKIKEIIKKESDFEIVGRQIKEFTKNEEVIRLKELILQIESKIEKDELIILLSYLYSLDIEVLHSGLIDLYKNVEEVYHELANLDRKLSPDGKTANLFLKISRKIQ